MGRYGSRISSHSCGRGGIGDREGVEAMEEAREGLGLGEPHTFGGSALGCVDADCGGLNKGSCESARPHLPKVDSFF